MSAGPPPGFDQGQAPPGEPSQEEMQAYLEQLRGAPVDQIVAEVASALLNAAQVKLGRQDGRLLIDLTGALADTGRHRVTSQLTEQLDQAVTQLRLAQVEAEQQVARQGGEEGDIQPAPGDDDTSRTTPDATAPTDQAAGATPPPSPPTPPQQGGRGTSRLWVPGQ